MSDIEIRPITADELEPFAFTTGTAFGYNPDPAEEARVRAILELDRTLAAFDAGAIVGTTAIFSFDMAVPGATLPTAGVTWVSVRPSHRRRGVLSRLMERQLHDIRERGEALAGLWASEAPIYGRFGYGMAAETCRFEIQRRYTEFAHAPSWGGRVHIVDREEALSGWPALFDRVFPTYPGFYSRSAAWWQNHRLRDPRPGEGGARFFAQYEEGGELRGYVYYAIEHPASDVLPTAVADVRELVAETDAAYAALWQYVLNLDLIDSVKADRRPFDEPLLHMLRDPRRLIRRPYDALWLRMLDVPRALSARKYASEGRVVLAVRDDFGAYAAGTFELEAGPDGAYCRATNASPNVILSAADLGAVYMGGVRFTTLARAGRVEGSPEALARADAMFAWDRMPWCPEMF